MVKFCPVSLRSLRSFAAFSSLFSAPFAPFCGYSFLSYLGGFASLREIFLRLSGYLRSQFELPIFVREDVFIIERMIKAVMREH